MGQWIRLVPAALAFVALVPGCGGEDETTLVYSAPGASPGDLSRSATILRKRAEALGAENISVETSPNGRIELTLSEGDGSLARIKSVASPVQLEFYDWEPNVIGLPGAGDPAEQPIGSRRAAASLAAENPGTIVVRDEAVLDDPATPADESTDDHGYFVIRDRPELSGDDLTNPEQGFSPFTNQPIVVFDFTAGGRRKFQDLTREIAIRGEDTAPVRAKANSLVAADFSDHFAVVLDREIVSRPIVDFVDNPNGIDGSNGAQIEGSFTIQEAQELAKFLAIGALPVEVRLVKPQP
jgi:preprotein translocase subunit SecD